MVVDPSSTAHRRGSLSGVDSSALPGAARLTSEVGRAHVLTAAARTFATLGYSGARIDDIAAEMGATKGRVYHYFRSKAEILEEILMEGASMLDEAVRPIASAQGLPGLERLERMAVRHARVLLEQNDVHVVALFTLHLVTGRATKSADASLFRPVAAVRDRYEGLWRSVVREGVADGSMDAPDVELAARAVLGALNWATVWYRPAPTDTPASRMHIARSLAQHSVRGVQRRTPGTANARKRWSGP